jgi:hypothetical protein
MQQKHTLDALRLMEKSDPKAGPTAKLAPAEKHISFWFKKLSETITET